MNDIVFYVLGSIFAAISLIIGLVFRFLPPKMNRFYGLRTKVTMENEKAWDYAHRICANTMLIYSPFSIITFVILCVVNPNFISERKYLLLVIGLLCALLGVLIAVIVVHVKTIKYANTHPEEFQQNEFIDL